MFMNTVPSASSSALTAFMASWPMRHGAHHVFQKSMSTARPRHGAVMAARSESASVVAGASCMVYPPRRLLRSMAASRLSLAAMTSVRRASGSLRATASVESVSGVSSKLTAS